MTTIFCMGLNLGSNEKLLLLCLRYCHTDC
jgi:hypothetical protein